MPTFTWRDTNNGHDYTSTAERFLFPRISPDGQSVASKDHDAADGRLLVNGEPVDPPLATWGNSPAAWHPNGTLVVQTDQSGILTAIAPDGERMSIDLRQSHAAYLPFATGIHHIDANWRIVLNAEPDVAHQVIQTVSGPVECWSICRDSDGTILALSNGGGPSGCVVKIEPGKPPMMWVAPDDIKVAPMIHKGRCAVSGQDTPSPDAIAFDKPFAVYVPPAPVLTVPEHPRAVWRGSFGIPNVPGSNIGGHGHPIAVLDGPRYIDAEDEKRLVGVIFDPTFSGNPPTKLVEILEDRASCLALALRTGCFVALYDDGKSAIDGLGTMQETCEWFAARGCAVVHLACGYPGFTPQDFGYPRFLVTTLRDTSGTEAAADQMRQNSAAVEAA